MFIKKKTKKTPQHMRISCLLFPPFPYLSEAMLVLDISYDCGLALHDYNKTYTKRKIEHNTAVFHILYLNLVNRVVI
jgi:hypothetical protein